MQFMISFDCYTGFDVFHYCVVLEQMNDDDDDNNVGYCFLLLLLFIFVIGLFLTVKIISFISFCFSILI